MHEKKGMAHLDIKLENIVLDPHYMLKIIDFAYSEPKENRMCISKGTERYFAPEVAQIYYRRQAWYPQNLQERPTYVAEKADIFSLGIFLFTLMFGQPPFFQNVPEVNPLLPFLCDPRPQYQEVYFIYADLVKDLNFRG